MTTHKEQSTTTTTTAQQCSTRHMTHTSQFWIETHDTSQFWIETHNTSQFWIDTHHSSGFETFFLDPTNSILNYTIASESKLTCTTSQILVNFPQACTRPILRSNKLVYFTQAGHKWHVTFVLLVQLCNFCSKAFWILLGRFPFWNSPHTSSGIQWSPTICHTIVHHHHQSSMCKAR